MASPARACTLAHTHTLGCQSTAILVGLGLVATGLGLKAGVRHWHEMKRVAALTGGSPFTHYYSGSFEPKMTRREASLILGVR